VIREYAHRVTASLLRIDDYQVTELYQTQDPEVVIAEMRTRATVTMVLFTALDDLLGQAERIAAEVIPAL
jgi:hypothetical protein